MQACEIRSIGVLNNADGSLSLSLCCHGAMMPIFVRITTEDYKAAGELAGIQANKQQAVEFYHRNGAGRH